MRHRAEHAARQKLERRIGGFIGIADRLAVFHFVEQPHHARIVLVDDKSDALELREHIGAARLIGNQNLAPVADALRRDMLVGRRLLKDRRGMDAGFGGEGAFADIGRMPVRRAVEHLVERVRDMREAC